MRNNQKKLPIAPLAVLLVVALTITLAGTLFGGEKETEQDKAVAAGIAYLEALEQKDPAAVKQVRQDIYQAEIDAQRDQILLQLNNGTMDPFSLIKDYVLLGDSRAVGFWYRNFLDRSNVLADGGHTIRNLASYVDTIVEKNPSQIFLCYGLNDSSIGYWDTAEEYVTEYMETVNTLREKLPDATIVVSSILPAKDPAFEKSSKWRAIPEWSAALEKACEENGILFANCDYLAVSYPNLWDPDGIHFRKEFYPYWASCLVAAMLMEGVE